MDMPREHIRWYLHERHLQSVFAMHFLQDRFCDVTLACKDGQTIRAHRTILCACSGYFDTVLAGDTSGKDTLVIMKDCDYQDIQLLIQFMYYGEINVDENRLRSLLKTAEGLQINGLTNAFLNINEDNHEFSVDASSRSKKPQSFSSFQDFHANRSVGHTNKTNLDAAASFDRIMEPLDGRMELGEPNSEDFNGWILAPMDDDVQRNEHEAPFDDDLSSEEKIPEENIPSHFCDQPEPEVLAPSISSENGKIENRNAARSPPQHQPGLSLKLPSIQSNRSTSRRSSTGTSKMHLLNRLHGYLQRSFDGRIEELTMLTIDDLQNYSVENEKGTCQVKCLFCDKPITVHYGKHHGEGSKKSYWVLSNIKRHLSRHLE